MEPRCTHCGAPISAPLRETRLNYRNGCIRWYARYVNAMEDMSLRAQAAAVHQAAERYRRGRWRFDQFKSTFEVGYFGRDDSKDEILFRLFSVSKDLDMPVPGERQIRRIIGPSNGR